MLRVVEGHPYSVKPLKFGPGRVSLPVHDCMTLPYCTMEKGESLATILQAFSFEVKINRRKGQWSFWQLTLYLPSVHMSHELPQSETNTESVLATHTKTWQWSDLDWSSQVQKANRALRTVTFFAMMSHPLFPAFRKSCLFFHSFSRLTLCQLRMKGHVNDWGKKPLFKKTKKSTHIVFVAFDYWPHPTRNYARKALPIHVRCSSYRRRFLVSWVVPSLIPTGSLSSPDWTCYGNRVCQICCIAKFDCLWRGLNLPVWCSTTKVKPHSQAIQKSQ